MGTCVFFLILGYMAEIFFPFFLLSGVCAASYGVSSSPVGDIIRLVRCPPNLQVAFNNIISEFQGGEAVG